VGNVPEEIQILPYGHVASKKGNFIADETAYEDILLNFNKERNDIVIDYEHQTLSGKEAPAAGWIKELIDKGKDGLWAKVEWTSKAREYLTNKEYRYLSPVIWVRKSDGRAVVIHSAALTNTPAVDGMMPIANKVNLFEEGAKTGLDNMQRGINRLLGLSDESFLSFYAAAHKKPSFETEPQSNTDTQLKVNKLLGLSDADLQNQEEDASSIRGFVDSRSIDDRVFKLLGLKEQE